MEERLHQIHPDKGVFSDAVFSAAVETGPELGIRTVIEDYDPYHISAGSILYILPAEQKQVTPCIGVVCLDDQPDMLYVCGNGDPMAIDPDVTMTVAGTQIQAVPAYYSYLKHAMSQAWKNPGISIQTTSNDRWTKIVGPDIS